MIPAGKHMRYHACMQLTGSCHALWNVRAKDVPMRPELHTCMQVADLEERIMDLERDLAATTKDYLLVRHEGLHVRNTRFTFLTSFLV